MQLQKTESWVEPNKCRECGCTELDASLCIIAAGKQCNWIEPDLCRRCALEIAEKKCTHFDSRYSDACDDLHRYMDLWGRWNWTEVAAEGRRLWNAMFKEEIEYNSPRDGLIAAVAAQAADGVFAAFAAMLDLEKNDLMDLVLPWYQYQDRRPEPVSPDVLADYIRDTLRERDDPSEPVFSGFIGE